MYVQAIDRQLATQHRASQDLQIPLRKAAHVEIMNRGIGSSTKAARGASSSPSSYPRRSK